MFSQTLNWKFIHAKTNKVLDLGEKGTIQEKLIETGELPNPFYGENEKEFGWIEDYEWTFTSDFDITDEQLKSEFIEVEFPSIDTYAKIYLNEQLVSQTDNAFHLHHFQIKHLLKLGQNQFKVVFTPPILFHQKAFEARKSKLPAPNDVGKIQVASMSRKPQYQFGWDWALRMNTIGFWKSAKIVAYNTNRIINAKYETKTLSKEKATVELNVIFANKQNQTVTIFSKMFGKNVAQILDGILKDEATLLQPELWYPRDHGTQYLYNDTIFIYDQNQNLIAEKAISFGVRKTELIQEKDQWGTSFYFQINGKKIFAKGANFIPMDVFPSRIKDEQIINLIEQADKANFNMIRVWGGGYYQDDVFYETCDKLGIMVWQDLMFACAMYPGDEKFLRSVENEFNYQIPRISAHPSVVYFNGNNEVDVAWKNWGFQSQYNIDLETQNQILTDYNKLFKELAPKVIKKWTNVPYVHTSPLSNWGKDEYFNHGTMHYWGVWHGKDPIEDFGLKSGRFNAEYGFQSFPEFSTLNNFSTEKDWDLNSAVMKHHQKSYVGNGMIKKHADILYGEADDFMGFVYFSQLTQAKAVSIAISGHRTDNPRTMGTLFWQMNDCWPAPTWSSIDYFNNWKALHYVAKEDYETVGVLVQTKELGHEKYFFVSDVDTAFTSKVEYKIYDLKGNLLFQNKFTIEAKPHWKQTLCPELLENRFRNTNYIVDFSWTNHFGKSVHRRFFHEGDRKRMKADKNAVQYELTSYDSKTKTASIKVKNTVFLADFWLSSQKGGVRFEQNFVNLLPGEHIFNIELDQEHKIEYFIFLWR